MVHVLFWFDVEDCTVTQSDDAAKRLALILREHGVRGTFKIVGQKARLLEQRVRYDVIDALREHDIGFHSNWHGLRPQVAEYLAPLDWDDGAAEFQCREQPGLDDVRRLFGHRVVTYGQPGPNWAPQVFPVLRRWGIPTYVSGYGYVGLDCQPFWYAGMLCTSHMHGRGPAGDPESHAFGLNFELGAPGEIEKHKQAFLRSHERLSRRGGLVSIMNHPCTLVLEEWFSTYMKPREFTEAGYRHFADFLGWVLAVEDVRPTCASCLPDLYPDLARGHTFSQDELAALSESLRGEISFQRLGDMAVSAAEAFGLLVSCLAGYAADGALPAAMDWRDVQNPKRRAAPPSRATKASRQDLLAAAGAAAGFVAREGRVPDSVSLGGTDVPPGDFLGAVAAVLSDLWHGKPVRDEVPIAGIPCRFEEYVDEGAAKSGWQSVMLPSGFTAPGLIELAKLGAWTLKPAVLAASP